MLALAARSRAIRSLTCELGAAQGAPSGPQALIHGYREFQLACLEPGDGGGHLSHRLIGAERLVTYEMHQAAVVEFDESARVKLLKPPPDLVNLPERRRCGAPGKGRGKRAGAGGSRTARVTWRGRAARGVPARHLLVARCAVAARRIRTAAGITAT